MISIFDKRQDVGRSATISYSPLHNLFLQKLCNGYLKVDGFQKTTVHRVYACGDNTTFMRSVSNSVAMGTLAGAMVNKELIDEAF